MNKRVLLINITRMGDLVQMGTLLQRLQHEWPGAEVDLVVDQRFALWRSCCRTFGFIVEYDFHRLVDESRAQTKDVVTLYQDMTRWAAPLVEAQGDRVVNPDLQSAKRTADVLCGRGGNSWYRRSERRRWTIHNPWMAYLTDVHPRASLQPFQPRRYLSYAQAAVAVDRLRRSLTDDSAGYG